MSQEAEHTGFSVDWLPLAEVAQAIGCNRETLRAWASAGRLALQEVHGVKSCQAFQAYDLAAAGRRPPAGLRRPPGYASAAAGAGAAGQAGDTIDPEISRALGPGVDPFAMDSHELSKRLLAHGVDPQKIRLAVAISNAQQRKREGEIRAGRNIPPDDVARMLRTFGQLFVEEVDESAARWAVELARMLRERYAIELGAKFPAHLQELEDFYRQQGQAILNSLRREVEDQVRGVQSLELST